MSSGRASSFLRGGGDENGLEILGGIDRGIADHKRDARRIGPVVLGRDRGVGGDDANAVERDVHRLRHGDRHHGGGALADIGGAGERGHAAVEIQLEVDQRVRLAGPVNRLGGAADIMRAGHAEAFARRQLAEALAPAAGALDFVETFGEPVAVHGEIIQRAGRRLQQIGAPHGKRIEPELARHAVDQTFEGVPHVDRAVPAHGAAGRQIGVDPVAVVFDRGNIVDALQQRAGIENGDDAVAGVSAAALHHLAFAGGHAPILAHAELQPDIGLRTGAMGDEGLFAGELHQHLAGGGAGQQRGDDLEIQRLDARAETAADERLDHADARGIHLQALRQHEVQVIADLRHGLHREAVGRRIVFGEARMRLDLRVIDLGAAEPLLAHQIGGSKTLADVAELD